jgi:iron complex transport system substrate-binding protein
MSARTIIKPVIALVAAALLAVSAGDAQARPQRIVSTNVCADQLVLLLANPAHIVSVSSLATDSQISNLADKARGYRVNHARAEEIIQLQPDLIIGDVQTGRHANRLAASIGVPVHLRRGEDHPGPGRRSAGTGAGPACRCLHAAGNGTRSATSRVGHGV